MCFYGRHLAGLDATRESCLAVARGLRDIGALSEARSLSVLRQTLFLPDADLEGTKASLVALASQIAHAIPHQSYGSQVDEAAAKIDAAGLAASEIEAVRRGVQEATIKAREERAAAEPLAIG